MMRRFIRVGFQVPSGIAQSAEQFCAVLTRAGKVLSLGMKAAQVIFQGAFLYKRTPTAFLYTDKGSFTWVSRSTIAGVHIRLSTAFMGTDEDFFSDVATQVVAPAALLCERTSTALIGTEKGSLSRMQTQVLFQMS